MHVFRVFDALNDIRNVVDNAEAIKECGGHFEGAISYTMSPVHTLDSFLDYGQRKLKDLGADSICIKDMAGMLTPYRTERMVKAFNAEIGLPLHIHSPLRRRHGSRQHPQGRRSRSRHRRHGSCAAGVRQLASGRRDDRGCAPGEPLRHRPRPRPPVRVSPNTGRHAQARTLQARRLVVMHMQVYSHQVPGMMSNLVSRLEIQNAADRLPEVMREIPKVRAEVGYPPLVTPLSQIVGTQAVFNVLTGKRWSVVSKEMKDYICGYYGKAPGRMDKDIVAKVVGNSKCCRPTWRPARWSPPPTLRLKKRSATSRRARRTCSCTPCSRTRRARS